MITTGFESRVKIQQIVDNQLPEFILSESPKAVDFLKQYYVSQEFQGAPVDIAENLDQYLNLNNLTPEVISGFTSTTSALSPTDTTVSVESTKGFPKEYGLFKINDEIFTYTGITTNSFTGCIRGFSGITTYRSNNNPEELIFSTSSAANHDDVSRVTNLSVQFLQEFYRKIKVLLAPGFEDIDFVKDLDVNSFIKQARNFYQSKGTDESFRILFNVLYGNTPKILNLEEFLLKPSTAEYRRRQTLITEVLDGDPNKLPGQMLKSSDETAAGPISEVEIITRNLKTFYKIQLFSGYNEQSLIEGEFKITPSTNVTDEVSIGSSIITVDSTVGFDTSGKLFIGNDTVTYSDKNVNQFFGVTGGTGIGVSVGISTSDRVYAEATVFGFEDGDPSKRVDLRVTGILSDLEKTEDYTLLLKGDNIPVKNLGEEIKNDNLNKKQFAFNSWIYNVRTRYEIEEYTNNELTLFEEPDKSSLRVGDRVDVLDRGGEQLVLTNVEVDDIVGKLVTLDTNIPTTVAANARLSVRRRYEYATSSPLALSGDKILSNVQNTYNENDEFLYMASNSLPSYQLTKNISTADIEITSSSNLNSIFAGKSSVTGKYTTLSFANDVPFITGDEIIYHTTGTAISGLESGRTYYVQLVGTSKNTIRLFNARSFINTTKYVEFAQYSTASTHSFTLKQHYQKSLSFKKALSKFPLQPNIQSGKGKETKAGQIGSLINGVEILSYKSNDYIFFGPLADVKIFNGGTGYDVINPPTVKVNPPTVGIGTTALVQAVVRGSFSEVKVDPQNFNINRVLSVTAKGGNGTGAELEAVVSKQFRELAFNASQVGVAATGGIDISDDTLTFTLEHNLSSGQAIVYNTSGNTPLGIGPFNGSNADSGRNLINGSVYYPQVVNNKTIYLYETESDYNAGINTVGFTTIGTGGMHKFRLFEEKNVISEIKVVKPGSGYENRKLHVKPVGINTVHDKITFNNHGFNDGDVVYYSTSGTVISGLSTSNQYRVLKIDDNNFRLADAGSVNVSAARTEYNRKNYVKLETTGTEYQTFAFPPVSLEINAEYIGAGNTITATPIVTGEIVDLYLYDEGTNYGSDVFNFHKRPIVKIDAGGASQFKAIHRDGRIIAVDIQNGGKGYTAAPELSVRGKGNGAKLRAVVTDGKVTDVIILNEGAGYEEKSTVIVPTSPGRNCVIEADVRRLTVNNQSRFGDENLIDFEDNLTYGVVGYSTIREGSAFDDPIDSTGHSRVIGWAHDGNPIYGPYAYEDPRDNNSAIRILKTGYSANISNINNRPSDTLFPLGFFVEDHKFDDSGDLDVHNGRFAKTPEFPNGVYAYYVGINSEAGSSGNLDPKFPYFIGDTFRSEPVDNRLDQSFAFNESTLVRNTFPYRVNRPQSGSDFLLESNEFLNQTSIVESASTGTVDSLSVVTPGDDYMVGNSVVFDNSGTAGGGATAEVVEVEGKEISDIETSFIVYENSAVIRESSDTLRVYTKQKHDFIDGDRIQIGTASTFVSGLVDNHVIGVGSATGRLSISVNANTGVSTDIYPTSVSPRVSAGSIIGIGTETLTVLNVFDNVLRVKRGLEGTTHAIGSTITYYEDSFTIPVETENFDSFQNFKTYFNPVEAVGIGTTTGFEYEQSFNVGVSPKSVSLPHQAIYIPNHKFKTGQKLKFNKPSSTNSLTVGITSTSTTFNLPKTGLTEDVYVINKGKDFIGIVTQVGLTTNSGGLFFPTSTASDNYEYFLETQESELTATAKQITTKVSISTVHGLEFGDRISLDVVPDLTLGQYGESDTYAGRRELSEISIKYDSAFDKILVNTIGFTSTSVNTLNNTLGLGSHGLVTGDKVFYNGLNGSVASGLSTGPYYVFRTDDNTLQLGETEIDVFANPPRVVSIASTGGANQELSMINPRIDITKNNTLFFDVSDASLSDYNLKLYYDNAQSNEFVSTGSTSEFSFETSVTNTGVTTSHKVLFGDDLPTKLFYTLEKDGVDIDPDTDVVDYSQILYRNSRYNREYSVFGIGATTFSVALPVIPEKLKYTQDQCKTLKYKTTSKNASGPISKLNILYGGSEYLKLPRVTGIATGTAASVGTNGVIRPDTTTIGKLNQFRILNEGFEYSIDRTLRPQAEVPKLIRLSGSYKITNIEVISGGKNFISAPDVTVVNMYTRKPESSGTLQLTSSFDGNTIVSIDILDEPKGLDDVEHRIFTERNSNGVSVEKIVSYNKTTGIVELELSTPPIGGFTTPPFKAGDEIFVEGLIKKVVTSNLGVVSSPGNGFNSKDNSYQFFKVTEFINSNPAILKYNIGEFTQNAGDIEGTGSTFGVQNQFTQVINKSNYPVFDVTLEPSIFFMSEPLQVNGIDSNLIVQSSYKDFIKVLGDYPVKEGDIILGKTSGVSATVNVLDSNTGRYQISGVNKIRYGWADNVGMLNNDLQVIPNNDYYQNLSYTIKSPQTWQTIRDFVNKMVHPTGMKNFADTEFLSKAEVSRAVISDAFVSPVLDFISERRVDTINAFDLVLDYDPTADSSRFILFKNKRLTDYVECRSNRVLQIDDISGQFSSSEFNKDTFTAAVEYPITNFYGKFLVQVIDDNKTSSQLSEIVVLNDFNNTYSLDRTTLFTDVKLGDFVGSFADSGDPALRFDPVDPNNFNYNLKVYTDNFDINNVNVGTGFTDFGFGRINAKVETVGPSSGNGILGPSTTVFEALANQFDTFYSYAHVVDLGTNEQNYFEIAAHKDASDNTYTSELFFDTSNTSVSSAGIGTFTTVVDNGVIKLNYTNENSSNNVAVRVKTVGIGSTAAGVGTYRYLVDGQLPGTETTAKFGTSFENVTGITTVLTYPIETESSHKALVKVSVGSTVSLHNLYLVSDQTRVTLEESPFLSVGTNIGIGTFSSEVDGTSANLIFHPDSAFASDVVTVQFFNQTIYTEQDQFNFPDPLEYGNANEKITNAFYGSINNFGKDRTAFDLNYKGIPIYQKTFNPTQTTNWDKATGVFSIDDHFFETGEELIYKPFSTLAGVAATSVGIGTTTVSGTVFTGDLITGFSTITGVSAASTSLITLTANILGPSIAANTTITGIGTTNTFFVGNVVAAGSSVITGVANTGLIKVGSGIFSGNNVGVGTVVSVGLNSITSTEVITGGNNRIYFSDDINYGITISNPGTATTTRQTYTTGITTDIMPETVYAIRVSKDKFKLTGTAGGSGIGFTFTSEGSGNRHKLTMKKKLEKALITIDGVSQYPIAYTPLTFDLDQNTPTGTGSIGAGVTFLRLSGISSVRPRDILKIDDEFLNITNVGLATTATGPITGIGTIPVVNVTRGFVGTSATTHTDGSSARIYKGAFNIVENKIHFTEAPDGKGNNDRLNSSQLALPKSTFNGRVYLRQDYTGNRIYDDISLGFNGIGRTFSVYNEGENAIGLEAGSNIVFINDIFQTPNTSNNVGNNYSFGESAGISSITFTGIKRPGTDEILIVDSDVNQNQIPRGGVVISVASTGGLGYAPLVGAQVNAEIGAGKSISNIVGIPTYGRKVYSISTASYDNVTGVLEITTDGNHGFIGLGQRAFLENLEFACAAPHAGVTTTTFPDNTQGFDYPILGITSGTTFRTNVGVSTIPHTYVGLGSVREYFNDNRQNFGSGYRGQVGVAVTDEIYEHKFVRANTGAVTGTGGPFTPTNAVYDSLSGTLTLTIPSHGRSSGNVQLVEDSFVFTCSRDDHATEHTYPRATDPAGGAVNLAITVIDADTLSVNVGVGGGAGTGAVITAEVVANSHRFESASANAVNVQSGSESGNEKTPTNATYDPETGVLTLTVASHGLSTSDTITLDANSIVFSCARDNFQTLHPYPRPGSDPIAGVTTAVTVTDANTFTLNVGYSPAHTGGSLFFTISDGGSNYVNPVITVDDPAYENLGFTGVSRLGLGNTSQTGVGLSMTFDLSPNPNTVGIGTSFFEVSEYQITKPGYSYRLGDVFEPVGLVTDYKLISVVDPLRFTVSEVFSDSFSSIQLGEFDYIDSIKILQDGKRKRFPLFFNNQLLSFQKNTSDVRSSLIDFDAVLLIYLNGVMQEPKVSYTFDGGTTFSFTEAPKQDDKVDIFFYRGTRNIDSLQVDVAETVKPGDNLHILKNDGNSTTVSQTPRIVSSIVSSDIVETGIYLGDGIDDTNYKPVDWTKQKRDLFINDLVESKARDSLEGMVFPTAKIIKDFASDDTEIFVDDAQFFNYEENESTIEIQDVNALLIDNQDPVAAGLSATVSGLGTISSIDVISGGSGYSPSSTVTLRIGKPVGGIGTVFKADIIDRVGTLGIGSDVIIGINTESLEIGQTLKAIPNILDTSTTIIGIADTDGGNITLSKSASNTVEFVNGFEFGRYQDQELAEATASVNSAGIVTLTSVTTAGAGYTSTTLPTVIAPLPSLQKELISGIRFVDGFAGIVTGIGTTVGTNGNSLALKFDVSFDTTADFDKLIVGYPIKVTQTGVGLGVTSIDSQDSSIVGIGSTFVDNIYYVHAVSKNAFTGIITSNILSTTDTNSIVAISSDFAGRFSWGRLAGFTRSSGSISVAVTGLSVDTGLSTFPSLQRRGFGLRDIGALRKELPN